MAGGLLNIISIGNNNVILTGNPTKTFFKVTYSKYTNFGLQKFRIDYDGLRDLRRDEESVFKFKIKRYADLLMDTYLVVTLPDIWSPIYNPCANTSNTWAPYEFRWIRDLGAQMIKEVSITCGNVTLQKYSGEYLLAMVQRDFSEEKKDLFHKMTGNVEELNDPSNSFGRSNLYPNAFYTSDAAGAEPSIRGRNLYIPINTWFTLNSRCAFPLVSLQYNELVISVTMRPIRELFQVRDVFDYANNYPYVQPNFTQPQFNMYTFLQTPPFDITQASNFAQQINTWNADIHLLSTYCFLSKDEAALFAMEDQVYLVKDVFEYDFLNITGSQKVELKSTGMVSSWMWYMQRNDVNLRNEWSNYTNWPYHNLPSDIMPANGRVEYNGQLVLGPGKNPSTITHPDGQNTGYFYSGTFTSANQKNILETMGILLGGDYRENILTHGVYNYVEKYVRTQGSAKEGLYCYNFCLNTSPFEYQPSGAINLSKFRLIELEVTTMVPSVDKVNSSYDVICNLDGQPIGIRSTNWKLYDYNYNMKLFEERYNILSFIGGNCAMLYAR
jgi:hypothetical protein